MSGMIRIPLNTSSDRHKALQLFSGQCQPFYMTLFHTMGKFVPKSLTDTDIAIASTQQNVYKEFPSSTGLNSKLAPADVTPNSRREGDSQSQANSAVTGDRAKTSHDISQKPSPVPTLTTITRVRNDRQEHVAQPTMGRAEKTADQQRDGIVEAATSRTTGRSEYKPRDRVSRGNIQQGLLLPAELPADVPVELPTGGRLRQARPIIQSQRLPAQPLAKGNSPPLKPDLKARLPSEPQRALKRPTQSSQSSARTETQFEKDALSPMRHQTTSNDFTHGKVSKAESVTRAEQPIDLEARPPPKIANKPKEPGLNNAQKPIAEAQLPPTTEIHEKLPGSQPIRSGKPQPRLAEREIRPTGQGPRSTPRSLPNKDIGPERDFLEFLQDKSGNAQATSSGSIPNLGNQQQKPQGRVNPTTVSSSTVRSGRPTQGPVEIAPESNPHSTSSLTDGQTTKMRPLPGSTSEGRSTRTRAPNSDPHNASSTTDNEGTKMVPQTTRAPVGNSGKHPIVKPLAEKSGSGRVQPRAYPTGPSNSNRVRQSPQAGVSLNVSPNTIGNSSEPPRKPVTSRGRSQGPLPNSRPPILKRSTDRDPIPGRISNPGTSRGPPQRPQQTAIPPVQGPTRTTLPGSMPPLGGRTLRPRAPLPNVGSRMPSSGVGPRMPYTGGGLRMPYTGGGTRMPYTGAGPRMSHPGMMPSMPRPHIRPRMHPQHSGGGQSAGHTGSPSHGTTHTPGPHQGHQPPHERSEDGSHSPHNDDDPTLIMIDINEQSPEDLHKRGGEDPPSPDCVDAPAPTIDEPPSPTCVDAPTPTIDEPPSTTDNPPTPPKPDDEKPPAPVVDEAPHHIDSDPLDNGNSGTTTMDANKSSVKDDHGIQDNHHEDVHGNDGAEQVQESTDPTSHNANAEDSSDDHTQVHGHDENTDVNNLSIPTLAAAEASDPLHEPLPAEPQDNETPHDKDSEDPDIEPKLDDQNAANVDDIRNEHQHSDHGDGREDPLSAVEHEDNNGGINELPGLEEHQSLPSRTGSPSQELEDYSQNDPLFGKDGDGENLGNELRSLAATPDGDHDFLEDERQNDLFNKDDLDNDDASLGGHSNVLLDGDLHSERDSFGDGLEEQEGDNVFGIGLDEQDNGDILGEAKEEDHMNDDSHDNFGSDPYFGDGHEVEEDLGGGMSDHFDLGRYSDVENDLDLHNGSEDDGHFFNRDNEAEGDMSVSGMTGDDESDDGFTTNELGEGPDNDITGDIYGTGMDEDEFGKDAADEFGEQSDHDRDLGVDEPDQFEVDEPDQFDVDEHDQSNVDEPDQFGVDEHELSEADEPDQFDVDEPEQSEADEADQFDIDEHELSEADEPGQFEVDDAIELGDSHEDQMDDTFDDAMDHFDQDAEIDDHEPFEMDDHHDDLADGFDEPHDDNDQDHGVDDYDQDHGVDDYDQDHGVDDYDQDHGVDDYDQDHGVDDGAQLEQENQNAYDADD